MSSKLKWTSKYPRTQLETALHRAQFSLDGSTDISIFSEIYSNWPRMFFFVVFSETLKFFQKSIQKQIYVQIQTCSQQQPQWRLEIASPEPQMSLKWASTQDQPVNDFYISFHCVFNVFHYFHWFFQCVFNVFHVFLQCCFRLFHPFSLIAHVYFYHLPLFCECFLDLFRFFWLIFIDLLKYSVFFPCFWVCLINHFFIVFSMFFNVFDYFSWIFTVCFSMFIVFPCFSNVLGCVILQNEFQNLNEPQSTLEHSSKQPDTGLNFHSMAQRIFRFLVKFTQIGLTCFFVVFSETLKFFQNQFKSRFMYKSRLAVSNNLNGDSK